MPTYEYRCKSCAHQFEEFQSITAAPAAPGILDERQTRRAMTVIILAQCAGMVGRTAFDNGFLLSYFSKLGIASSSIMYLLSTVDLMIMFLVGNAQVKGDQCARAKGDHHVPKNSVLGGRFQAPIAPLGGRLHIVHRWPYLVASPPSWLFRLSLSR
jgi:hypothetical protein